MSFEEEFDSIIRRKAEEEKYPFDESNWDKTNSLLDAERKASRAVKFKKFYLPAALVVALGSAGFIAFEYFNTPATDNKVASVTQPIPSAEKFPAIETSQSQTPENTNNNPVNSNGNIPATANLNIANPVSANNAKTSSEAAHVSEAPAISKNNSSVKNLPSVSGQKESAIAANSKISSEQLRSETKEIKNTSDASSAAVAQLNDASPAKQTAKAPGQISENNTSSGSNDVQNSTPKDSKDLVYTNNNLPEQTKENETSVQDQIQASPIEESKFEAEQLSAVYSALPLEVIEQDITPNPFIYLNRYDDDYYKNTNTPKKHYLNVEIGGNYLLGWDAKKGTDGKGMNGFAGFNYGRYLSNKISISIGLQAYNIANINQPFYLISSKEYGFGSTNIYTRVTSNQLYYVAVPLKFNYAINSSNIIGFGINAAYLVGADNTVSKYYLLDNEEKSIGSSTTHNKGVYTGTNMVNMMLSAHYKTQFGKRIGLNLEFNYGLTDIFKNTDAIKTSERPMGVRLGLSYTLFDK